MRRFSLYLFIFVCISSFIISCKSDSYPPDNKVQDGTLHIRKKTDAQKLHPFVYPSPKARDIYQYIFPQLADFDPVTLKLIPVLIKAIPEEIKITEGPNSGSIKFTIEYLPEAKWDDDKDVTAQDYIFSVKTVKNLKVKAGGYRSHLQFISDIIVDPNNPKKFDVIFSKDYLLAKETALTIETYPAHIYDPKGLTTSLSLSDAGDENKLNKIIAKDSTLMEWADDMNGIKYGRELVNSCGPYQLSEWVTDEYIILDRKENYWAKGSKNPFLIAGPKRIIFDILPDETTAITQLSEGNIDLVPEVSGAVFSNLQKEENGYQFLTPQLTKYYLIAMNNDSPGLSDKTVRKALGHLLDVDNIMKSIDFGNGTRTIGPIHPGKNYYNSKLSPITYDVNKAKSMLNEAGWKDSNSDGTIDKMIGGNQTELELDMYVSEGKLGQQIALLMKEATAGAGIKMNIIQKPFKQIESEHLKKKDFDMAPMMIRQDLVLDDPYTRWHSDHTKLGGRNIYGFENEEIDKITKEIQISEDPITRNKLYTRVQEILYEEQPVIFLYAPSERMVGSDKWNMTSTVRRPGYMANTFTLK